MKPIRFHDNARRASASAKHWAVAPCQIYLLEGGPNVLRLGGVATVDPRWN
jgi:hypothetical protein